jgi:CheY-like chemotaxis protein
LRQPEYNESVLDKPVVILASEAKPLEKSEWESTDAWLKTLGRFGPTALGLVLPLELPGRFGRRGELWGVELLRWLRWSAPESIRLVPVLAVAWQPLEMILRAKHEPLLVSRGTWFARLPDVLEGSPSFQDRFITQVRTEPERLKISLADLEFLSGGSAGEATRLTHHDLANEGYSAWRLWAGYLQALRLASVGTRNTKAAKNTLAWAEKVGFTWLDELKQRMQQPSFQQFQILRRSTAPPKYPEVEDANQLVRDHANKGLPQVLRVLLVDDEFDKGLADALLKILFGNVEFTYRLPDGSEKVYCALGADSGKGSWARFVCVKNTQAAAHWLRLWREFKALPPASERSYADWLASWAQCIGRNPRGLNGKDLEDVLTFPGADASPPLDACKARPAYPVTVILLDLRLSRKEPEASYSPADFDSLRFRNAVKEDRPDLPVVMLTASRQALNYIAAMAGAGPQDGWLTKEAPDVPVDDDNSSRSVHYLLSRLHVFSTLAEWYRPELEWSSEQIREFAAFWSRPDRDQLLETARREATEIFTRAKNPPGITVPRTDETEAPVRILGYVTTLHAWTHPLLPRLVARKVGIACLLQTADWSAAEPVWDASALNQMVPQDELNKCYAVEGIYEAVPFHRDLWIRGRGSPVTRLLVEEYEWLLKQDWGQVGARCKGYVKRLLEAARAGK